MKKSKNQSNKKNRITNEDLLKKIKDAQEESNLKEEEPIPSRDEELQEAKDQALRAVAELQNTKRRAEEEISRSRKYASENLLKNLLPMLDNFERATHHLPDDIKEHDWVKGILSIEQNLSDILKKEGLEEIPARTGDLFDSNFHEGIMQDATSKNGTIGQCLEKGYTLHGKALRYAKVSVGTK